MANKRKRQRKERKVIAALATSSLVLGALALGSANLDATSQPDFASLGSGSELRASLLNNGHADAAIEGTLAYGGYRAYKVGEAIDEGDKAPKGSCGKGKCGGGYKSDDKKEIADNDQGCGCPVGQPRHMPGWGRY